MTLATITLASAARLVHVQRQQDRLVADGSGVHRVVVWLDAEPPADDLRGAAVVHVPPHADGLRLAAGRNAGVDAAIAAGCDELVLLDADCVAGPRLLERYAHAMRTMPEGLHAGPVTYLAEGVVVDATTDLGPLTRPHAARPAPPDGDLVVASPEQQLLFWSLSFAVTASTWRAIGGFDEGYVGYGGEDTDFAMRAVEAGAALTWVGGADAYHQHHPTSAPPWQHLDDILRNGRRFADRWGFWPMEGWLRAFSDAGAIVEVDGDWRRTPADAS